MPHATSLPSIRLRHGAKDLAQPRHGADSEVALFDQGGRDSKGEALGSDHLPVSHRIYDDL